MCKLLYRKTLGEKYIASELINCTWSKHLTFSSKKKKIESKKRQSLTTVTGDFWFLCSFESIMKTWQINPLWMRYIDKLLNTFSVKKKKNCEKSWILFLSLQSNTNTPHHHTVTWSRLRNIKVKTHSTQEGIWCSV
jgi:hypothetical protein